MTQEQTQNKGKWTWKRPGAYKVLELAKQGKSVPEIAEEVRWREDTVWHFMSSPLFLQKLGDYLNCVFFNFQKNKILALEEISQLFHDVIVGRKQVEGLSVDQASKHLVKLLNLKEKEPTMINPKQYNIIMNVEKNPEPRDLRDLAEIFGFKDLQIPETEGPENCPE